MVEDRVILRIKTRQRQTREHEMRNQKSFV